MTEELQNTQTEEVTQKIIVCVDGADYIRDYEALELTFNSSEEEILNTIQPIILEEKGVNIQDTESGWLYKVRKSTDSQNIHIVPNSTAG